MEVEQKDREQEEEKKEDEKKEDKDGDGGAARVQLLLCSNLCYLSIHLCADSHI